MLIDFYHKKKEITISVDCRRGVPTFNKNGMIMIAKSNDGRYPKSSLIRDEQFYKAFSKEKKRILDEENDDTKSTGRMVQPIQ
jgi:hypothetical protein